MEAIRKLVMLITILAIILLTIIGMEWMAPFKEWTVNRLIMAVMVTIIASIIGAVSGVLITALKKS